MVCKFQGTLTHRYQAWLARQLRTLKSTKNHTRSHGGLAGKADRECSINFPVAIVRLHCKPASPCVKLQLPCHIGRAYSTEILISHFHLTWHRCAQKADCHLAIKRSVRDHRELALCELRINARTPRIYIGFFSTRGNDEMRRETTRHYVTLQCIEFRVQFPAAV